VGDWPPGGRIPGVRELALELSINPNTVQRAFGELERDGLVRTERTTGRFVNASDQLKDTLRRDLATSAADAYAHAARGLGLNQEQAINLLQERWHVDDDVEPTGT
jgi:DNA-binding transcriptional regulator YhcF (GntR family)